MNIILPESEFQGSSVNIIIKELISITLLILILLLFLLWITGLLDKLKIVILIPWAALSIILIISILKVYLYDALIKRKIILASYIPTNPTNIKIFKAMDMPSFIATIISGSHISYFVPNGYVRVIEGRDAIIFFIANTLTALFILLLVPIGLIIQGML